MNLKSIMVSGQEFLGQKALKKKIQNILWNSDEWTLNHKDFCFIRDLFINHADLKDKTHLIHKISIVESKEDRCFACHFHDGSVMNVSYHKALNPYKVETDWYKALKTYFNHSFKTKIFDDFFKGDDLICDISYKKIVDKEHASIAVNRQFSVGSVIRTFVADPSFRSLLEESQSNSFGLSLSTECKKAFVRYMKQYQYTVCHIDAVEKLKMMERHPETPSDTLTY